MKHLLLCGLLAMAGHFIQAQSVFPVHEQMPEWQMQHVPPPFWEPDTVNYKIITAEEETICGEKWTPAYRKNIPGPSSMLLGYYRVVDSRVFFRQSADCNDAPFLLYDFDLEVGDSVQLYYNIGLPTLFWFKVLEITTQDFGGVPRKHMLLRAFFSPSSFPFPIPLYLDWVEGIGDLWHPFYFYACDGYTFCEGTLRMLCLRTETEGVLYAYPGGPCNYEENLRRIYVNQNVSGGQNNGRSWSDAFIDLQDAIAIADPGDTIWVAQGAYLPTAEGNRETSFVLPDGVAIYGGFNGTETALEQRDWELYPTLLSGDIGIQGDSTDNSYHVVYALGVDSSALLDGFVITRGQALHPNPNYFGPLNNGGGLMVDTDAAHPETSPRITHCTFLRNTARKGGGMYCAGADGRQANPILRYCTFSENRALETGGGLHKNGPAPVGGSIIRYCTFEKNTAAHWGGGVLFNDVCGKSFFKNCTFLNNNCISDGGGLCFFVDCLASELEITDCHFEGNIGATGGGACVLFTGVSLGDTLNVRVSRSNFIKNISANADGGGLGIITDVKTSNISIEKSLFSENEALDGGGSIYVEINTAVEENVKISNCVFHKNNVVLGPGRGGAIFIRGGILNSPRTNYTLVENCLFDRNRGAFEYLTGYPATFDADFVNCTFYRNGEYPIAKYWSQYFNYIDYYSRISFYNCILWEPGRPLNRLLYNGHPDNLHLYDYYLRQCLISVPACNLAGGPEACLEGMIYNTYPVFTDTLNSDFHLAACSPALNTGSNLLPDSLGITADLDGQVRILEEVADIGAYEREQFAALATAIQDVSCQGAQDGSVTIAANGNPPYAYTWSTASAQGIDTSGLTADDYTFVVRDALGCTDTLAVHIESPEPLMPFATATPASGADTVDGALQVDSISGGASPFRLLWSTGDTTASVSGLPPGNYTLTVTDAHDCIATLSIVVDIVNGVYQPESGKVQFNLWPNPQRADQALQLNYTGLQRAINSYLQISNSAGQRIWETNWNMPADSGNIAIPTTDLPSGIYFVTLALPGEAQRHWRVVIQ